MELIFCDVCGRLMLDGYIVYGGAEYYCSKKCLLTVYTEEEYQEMYDEDDAFWTEWDEDE